MCVFQLRNNAHSNKQKLVPLLLPYHYCITILSIHLTIILCTLYDAILQ